MIDYKLSMDKDLQELMNYHQQMHHHHHHHRHRLVSVELLVGHRIHLNGQ
jgi:hypothetical protein